MSDSVPFTHVPIQRRFATRSGIRVPAFGRLRAALQVHKEDLP